ncbi:hypothetical protein MAR_013985, partial [Mya arenaria]
NCQNKTSVRFDCSISTVSWKIIAWVSFLFFTLGLLPIWLSIVEIDKHKQKPTKDHQKSCLAVTFVSSLYTWSMSVEITHLCGLID